MSWHFFEIKMMEHLNLKKSVKGTTSDMSAASQHLPLADLDFEDAWGAEGATGSTYTNMLEEWKRKGEVQDRKMAAIMELVKMLTRKVIKTKVWSVNAIGTVERMEQIDDEIYFLNDEKEYVVANHGAGSPPSHQKESQGFLRQGYENQGQNYEHATDWGKREREKSP
ncbi:hypothetical protein HAX54_013232 [Datura stramonium]|uniref:Uncharacterized protein n=1 Tax=Datura stramonium TaxID=4076 RepID=A0ABS8TMK3_DATST|nr:hypothetical protein [Datura stramonium]